MAGDVPLRALLAGAAIACAVAAAPEGARAASVLTKGIVDDPAFADDRAGPRRAALSRSRDAGARIARLTLDWSVVAPGGDVKPPGFDAADPAAPEYSWGYVEDFVRDADRRGLSVMLTIANAPAWAQGADRPPGAAPGAWRPDPAELALFARAAARRFSGLFPDPKSTGDGLTGRARALPWVRHWQVWAEPNGGRTLQPAFEGGAPVAAEHYRLMLNSAAAALEAVREANVVIAAGTAATGAGGGISPTAFWRDLLCLDGSPCPAPARFDVQAHHPVLGRSRPSRSLRGGGVGLPDLSRLRALVRSAVRRGTVSPARSKPLWVTEAGWDTRPFATRAVSRATQARNAALLFRIAASEGADAVFWRGLRDSQRPDGDPFPTVASGLFDNPRNDGRRDRAKPALGAYRFPFVVERSGRRRMAWGLAPGARRATVVVERRVRGRWRRVARVRVSARARAFRVSTGTARGTFRARVGRQRSRAVRSG